MRVYLVNNEYDGDSSQALFLSLYGAKQRARDLIEEAQSIEGLIEPDDTMRESLDRLEAVEAEWFNERDLVIQIRESDWVTISLKEIHP